MQYVSIGNNASTTEYIKHGVPQGSVLGPLLFLIYINDLNTCIKHCTTRHFADDTNLIYTIDPSKLRNRNPTRKLNRDLKSLNNWLLANKISLNSTKTELIYFRNKKTPIPSSNIKLNGIKLQQVADVKYVGVILDEHMTFECHVKLLNAKLKKSNNLLAISRHYISKPLLIQIYYGQFYLHLTYGCLLWGGNENTLSKTFTLQKKAIHLISFKDPQEPSSPLFKELELLKLSDIIKLNNILFTHSCLNNQTPPIFQKFFKYKDINNHSINVISTHRNLPGSLEIPPPHSDTSKNSLQFICPSIWNSTHRDLSKKYPDKFNGNPQWIKDLSTTALEKILKHHYLEQY